MILMTKTRIMLIYNVLSVLILILKIQKHQIKIVDYQ